MTDKPGTSSKGRGGSPAKGSDADPKQYTRFLEAARELGCEENADRIDEVVRRAAKMPPPRRELPQPKKGKKAGS